MQETLSRAAFESWVGDTRTVGWQAQTRTLQVAGRESYAVDWLASKLNASAAQLISEILGQACTVQFVEFEKYMDEHYPGLKLQR